MIKTETLIKDNNPLLREKSIAVTLPLNEEDTIILESMLEHIRASQDEALATQYELRTGVGLAAIQIGVKKRMCIICYEDESDVLHEYALVNPKITSHSVRQSYLSGGEGCLSVDYTVEGHVPRYEKVTVKGYDMLTDQDVVIKARGYLAIVLQHELDHFDGVLFYDRINKQNPLAPIPNAICVE